MSDVVLEQVTKKFGDHVAVKSMNLTVEKGELVSLLGPSGCGKSTTLRMLAGFLEPEEGEIHVNNQNVTRIPANKRDTALVFQNYALFPHMTIFDNVAFGLKMRKVSSQEMTERVNDVLEMVDLASYGKRYPSQLSGGQQQRVALARALIVNPKLLLLDEPLSNLDAKLRERMRIEIRQLQRKLGLTTIFVTHDQEEALVLSDRIAVIEEGRIRQIGTPQEVFEQPKTHFVADFVGVRNFFGGAFKSGEFHSNSGLVINAALDEKEGVRKIGIRSNMIVINPPDAIRYENHFKGTVQYITYRGMVVEVTVNIYEKDLIVAEIPSEQYKTVGIAEGEEVVVCWSADRVLPMVEVE